MAKYDYNIIVKGTGSCELASSYTASVIKANVALIEKHKIGGDCLNFSITLPDKKDLD
jgi:pyruvate/2-oxoglutarate dehydrogenase complex dihydrolipoamide dehydrogenase (E3) component